VGRNTVTKVGDGKSLDVFGTFERKTLFGTTRDEIDNCTPEDTKSTVMSYSAEFWSPLIAVSSVRRALRLLPSDRMSHCCNVDDLVFGATPGSGSVMGGVFEDIRCVMRGLYR